MIAQLVAVIVAGIFAMVFGFTISFGVVKFGWMIPEQIRGVIFTVLAVVFLVGMSLVWFCVYERTLRLLKGNAR